METRRLGRTGLDVTFLGLGCVEINTESEESPSYLTTEGNSALLNTVLDTGVNVIDTAECYGNSEEQIGKALAGRRDEYYLFSKCGHAAGLSGEDWDPKLLERSIERSLRRLATDHIDVMLLHSCTEDDLRRGDVLTPLLNAQRQGKIRYTGYSGDGSAARFAVACGAFDVLETSASILDQESLDTTIPAAQAAHMGVVAKRPIGNAVWTFRERPESQYLHSYWERYHKLDYDLLSHFDGGPIEAALRFAYSIDGVHTAIVGTGRISHWEVNFHLVGRGFLSPQEWHHIRSRWAAVSGGSWQGER